MGNIIGGEYYGSGDSVQNSFKYSSHELVSIAGTASTSAAISAGFVFLSLSVASHVKIGTGAATTADMTLPPGLWPIKIDKGDTISLIQLSGGSAGQGCIIIGEGA